MTDCTELLKTFKIISAVLLILFSVFLLNLKKGNRLSHRFLAVFFLSRASILLTMLFLEYDLVLKIPNLAYLSTPFLFLYAPMLFLYTDSVTRPGFRFSPVKMLHLIPFIVRSLIYENIFSKGSSSECRRTIPVFQVFIFSMSLTRRYTKKLKTEVL